MGADRQVSGNVGNESRFESDHGSGPVALDTLVEELMGSLEAQSSGRNARTVMSGPRMRAVVMALAAGAEMAEHESPPAATLHVLRGHVTLSGDDASWEVRAGEVLPIPAHRHAVRAHDDSAFLLTVAL